MTVAVAARPGERLDRVRRMITGILMVDDRNIGNLVHQYLERDGYRVTWVRSGEEALSSSAGLLDRLDRGAGHPAGHPGLGAAEVPAADLVEHLEFLLAPDGELGGVVVAQGDRRAAVAGRLEVRVGHPARAARLVGAPDVELPDLVVVADAERVAGAKAYRIRVAGHVRLDDAHALRLLELGHGPSTVSSTHDTGTQPWTPVALRQRR